MSDRSLRTKLFQCYTLGGARVGDAIRDVGVEDFSSTDVGLGNVRLGDVRLRMSDKGC